jgi:large subunit ribosomal protein L4
MAELEVRKRNGEIAGKARLDPEIFEAAPNAAVMHQALVRQLANARQGTASTRTRTEVSGGGRKPYRQKGTGRARQGSIRAAQFRGGGIVFGPHPRDYVQRMPRKQRRLALRSALSTKLAEQHVVVFDDLDMEAPKTRELVAILNGAGIDGSVLVALENHNVNVEKSARNIPGVKVVLSRNLNVRDVLDHDWLLATPGAIAQLEEVAR